MTDKAEFEREIAKHLNAAEEMFGRAFVIELLQEQIRKRPKVLTFKINPSKTVERKELKIRFLTKEEKKFFVPVFD